MNFSVALCSYNGAKYIKEQIFSILEQTMPVDEIVICDDGSTDETLQIIEKIRVGAPIDIRVYKNELNLGVCANFQKAINLCKGDVVFLSDQDDVWLPEKVETVASYLENHPKIDVVFTDADLIDNDGNSSDMVPTNLWGYHFVEIDRKVFDSGMQIEPFVNGRVHATGATMAARHSFIVEHPFLPLWEHGEVMHDYAISLMAAERNKLGYINAKLIKYRLHQDQTCSVFFEPFDIDYQIYVINNCILPFIHNEQIVDRIDFAKFRLRQTRRLIGSMRLLLKTPQYRSLYGKKGWVLLKTDLVSWKKMMNNRVLDRNKKIC